MCRSNCLYLITHELMHIMIKTDWSINTRSAVIFRSFILFFIFFPLLGADINAMRSGAKEVKSRKVRIGQCFPNTMVVFDKSEGSSVNLVGKSKGYEKRTPCWIAMNFIDFSNFCSLVKQFIIPSSILIGIFKTWELVVWTRSSTPYSVERSPPAFSHPR